MSRYIAGGCVLMMLLVCASAGGEVVGTLRLHTIDAPALGGQRTLRVWLPPGFVTEPDEPYPVMYLHDGQNLFDPATSPVGAEWKIDETLTRLIEAGTIKPVVVVGIDNGQDRRIDEYTFTRHERLGGGQGARHEQFLLETVIPMIEKTYPVGRTREKRVVGGSSLGALMALELARRHPQTFGHVLAMSPSLWWPGHDLLTGDPVALRATRVWLDVGQRETGDPASDAVHVNNVRMFAARLRQAGVRHQVVVEPAAAHHESAWAGRFPDAARWLLSPSD